MLISDWSSDVCSSDRERVEHLLADVDAEQRRHRHEDVAGRDQRREMLEEQRREQCGDVQAVGIGIGQDHDLAVAQAGHVVLAWVRSEEHTSELQSLMRISYAVFCLKNKKNENTHGIR